MDLCNNLNVLEVIDLEKSYKDFSLNKINFSIKKGNITGFIGINGAGKSTTIKAIAGLINPTSGKIKFWGETINNKNQNKIKNKLGFLLDGKYYYPELKLNQMKKILSRAYSNWDEEICNELTKKFGLPINKKISQLSKGTKMKFSLVMALSHHAEILIMDEPTCGLDPLARNEFINILKNLAKNGVSILLSSHITSDLEDTANDIILIDQGNIIFQKETKKLESSHFIVKGKVDDLTSENQKIFLKINKKGEKFKGISNYKENEICKCIPNANVKNADIETIMLGYIFGRKACKST